MTLSHESFVTTSKQGLRHHILPMRLYHKAKRLGIWDPRSIDFSQDVKDWQGLSKAEQEVLLQLTALFQAGEESVTQDILPLIMRVAQDGHLEEEMFLTTFLWEEAKHTEFFRRFLDEVVQIKEDLHHYHTPSYKQIFYDELPSAMNALLTDKSTVALAKASATYNMIVEGVLAETGYYSYYSVLEKNDLMPGLRQGIGNLKRDESRHIAYGVFLISRLVAADKSLWPAIEERMNLLLIPALGMVQESFANFDNTSLELDMQEYLNYAVNQFNKRVARIQKAQGQTLEEIYQVTVEEAEM